MKKWVSLLLCLAAIFALVGCGSNTSAVPEEKGSVDIDLTELSATMVYSEVYNMRSSPEDYIGKTVKVNGSFTSQQSKSTGDYRYACIIRDVAACCAQGIEFVPTAAYTYPDDFPELDGEICVVGTFDTYKLGKNTYCILRDATLE